MCFEYHKKIKWEENQHKLDTVALVPTIQKA